MLISSKDQGRVACELLAQGESNSPGIMTNAFETLGPNEKFEASVAADFVNALNRLIEGRSGDFQVGRPGEEAARLFVDALTKTIAYMKFRKGGGAQDSTREAELTTVWNNAGHALLPIDEDLARRCYMKGMGWTDPDVWERARKNGMKIGIPDMELALGKLRAGYDMTRPVPSWFPIAGVCFAALAVLFLMYMIVGGPNLDPDRTRLNMLSILVALCFAASGAFIGGDAVAKGRIPFFENSPITFSAVGGVGIFVVVYLILHYTIV